MLCSGGGPPCKRSQSMHFARALGAPTLATISSQLPSPATQATCSTLLRSWGKRGDCRFGQETLADPKHSCELGSVNNMKPGDVFKNLNYRVRGGRARVVLGERLPVITVQGGPGARCIQKIFVEHGQIENVFRLQAGGRESELHNPLESIACSFPSLCP